MSYQTMIRLLVSVLCSLWIGKLVFVDILSIQHHDIGALHVISNHDIGALHVISNHDIGALHVISNHDSPSCQYTFTTCLWIVVAWARGISIGS